MLNISVLKSRARRGEAITFLALSLCHGRGEDPSEVGWHHRGTEKLPPRQSAAQGSLQPMGKFWGSGFGPSSPGVRDRKPSRWGTRATRSHCHPELVATVDTKACLRHRWVCESVGTSGNSQPRFVQGRLDIGVGQTMTKVGQAARSISGESNVSER